MVVFSRHACLRFINLQLLALEEAACSLFDVKQGGASHIRWVQAAGLDEDAISLALCVLHKKPFDLGALTISKDGRLLVSEQTHGSSGFDGNLMQHNGKSASTTAATRVGLGSGDQCGTLMATNRCNWSSSAR